MGAMKNTMKAGAALLAFALSAGTAWGGGVTATLKGGYFLPTAEVFRDVYSGGLTFGADVTVPIGGVFQVWTGVEYFGKTGLTTVTEEETKVRVVPVHLGLRCEFGEKALHPYVGAAAAYFLLHEENALGTVSEGGLGFLAQAGVMARIGGAVWLDIHAGYRGCKLTLEEPEPIEANLDGISAGFGIAFRF